jgi:hypothetical protein
VLLGVHWFTDVIRRCRLGVVRRGSLAFGGRFLRFGAVEAAAVE